VPKARVELARSFKLRQILSLVRLPIPPLRQAWSVREEGLEPTRLAALASKTSASASSATLACRTFPEKGHKDTANPTILQAMNPNTSRANTRCARREPILIRVC
jgi:hypothetical protein